MFPGMILMLLETERLAADHPMMRLPLLCKQSPHVGNLGCLLSRSNHLPMWSELSYQVMSSSGVSRTSSEIMIQQTIDWPGLLTYAYDSLPALTMTLLKLET